MPSFQLPPQLQQHIQSVGTTLKRLATVQPKEPKLTVGLDLGSSSLKVVVLGARRSSGARPLLAQTLVPLGESPGDHQMTEAIAKAVGEMPLSIKSLNLSVSGQWVIMRVVEMPMLKPEELAQALPFEAQRHLPFNVQDVVLDGAILGPADGNRLWVLVVACKREVLERRLGLVKQAGLEPLVVDVDALALANAFAAQPNGHTLAGTQALMNLGAQWTNVVVLKDRVPYLVRDIPWGAGRLIRQIAEQLGVEASAVAAQMKQSGSVAPELLNAMKASCESVTADLQLSFDFFESRFGTPPERILVSGGLSQCAGFLEALKSYLAQPLVPWIPVEGLTSQFAVAYGLALRVMT